MRFLFAALMIALAIAAACNIPEQIRNADRRGGHRMVWPAFDRTAIRWPNPKAIERTIDGEWAEARRGEANNHTLVK
jgi:hypothetical protein